MYPRNIAYRVIPIFILTGCTANLEELRTITPNVSTFSGSLASEYLAYSESEAEQGRIFSAEHFATKGLSAAQGKMVEPDEVDSSANNYKALAISRLALTDILQEDIKDVEPQRAARTQLLFDCWNKQESENSSGEDVPCLDSFRQAYNELQRVADELEHGEEVKHSIQFSIGSSVINDESRIAIAEIAEHIAGHPEYALELNSNYGVKNKKTKQWRLAQKRVAAVRRALIRAGVDPKVIFVAKPSLALTSGRAVHLSNDEIMATRNAVEIIMTSTKRQSVEEQ